MFEYISRQAGVRSSPRSSNHQTLSLLQTSTGSTHQRVSFTIDCEHLCLIDIACFSAPVFLCIWLLYPKYDVKLFWHQQENDIGSFDAICAATFDFLCFGRTRPAVHLPCVLGRISYNMYTAVK